MYVLLDAVSALKTWGQWPDGGAYLDQPNLLVEAVLEAEVQLGREREADAKRKEIS